MVDIGIGALATIGLLVVAKILGNLFDRILEHYTGNKIVDPALDALKWRWEAFKTRKNPIEATFEIKYTPATDFSIREGKDLVSEVLEAVEVESRNRVEIGTLSWDEDGQGVGFVEADHVECNHPFNLEISLLEDPAELRENPGAPFEEKALDAIQFKVHFKFAFRNLEGAVQNVGAFASFLETSLEDTTRGTLSDGQFIIHPVESNLTLDEWIKEEGFDVSLLLANRGENVEMTEVEFFPDHAEIHPPHLEVDSETTRYIELMILNYYLRGQ